VSRLRVFAVSFATALSAVITEKYASIPVKMVGQASPRVQHYFYVIENDGNSGITFFLWSLALVPVCAGALFVWSAIRLDQPRPLMIDLLFFTALVAMPNVLFYGAWGAEGWYVLPVALIQSAFAIIVMTAVFRLLLAWRPAALNGH
jgi:hypothetical protein